MNLVSPLGCADIGFWAPPSIVNVMRASGCDVPQWMLDLKNPSKDDKKRLLLRPISRKDVSKTNGAGSGAKSDRKRVEKTRVLGGKLKEREKTEGGEEKGKGKGGKGKKGGDEKKAKKPRREITMDE